MNEQERSRNETHESSSSSTEQEQSADSVLLSSRVELGHLKSSLRREKEQERERG